MSMIACRNFSGYKPCVKSEVCDAQCASLSIPQVSLLIVHLGALGAVVRSTSLLKAIKRKFPNSMITWVTDTPANKLLQNHPAIDRVLTTSSEDLLSLSALEFDVGFVIDKSLKAAGVLKKTAVDQVYGFVVNPLNGAILPATSAAEELWSLGLDNHKKFFVNTKPETQLIAEALELPYQQDEYWLPLTAKEEVQRIQRRCEFLSTAGKDIVIGINTGCSHVISYKKLTVDFQRQMVQEIARSYPNAQIVLLGGPEDTVRNDLIARDLPVINTATESGLRDGLVSVSACDVVITGDSLGMHMAISQGCQVVAWFGPTCAHEIDLFGRGVALKTQSPCSPCWKRTCEKPTMCYDRVPLEDFLNALESCCADRLSRRPAVMHTSAEEDQSHIS